MLGFWVSSCLEVEQVPQIAPYTVLLGFDSQTRDTFFWPIGTKAFHKQKKKEVF